MKIQAKDLQQIMSEPLPKFDEKALHKAQEILYDAYEEFTGHGLVKPALKALIISPYCVDAYTIIAEQTSDAVEAKQRVRYNGWKKIYRLKQTQLYYNKCKGLVDNLIPKSNRKSKKYFSSDKHNYHKI